MDAPELYCRTFGAEPASGLGQSSTADQPGGMDSARRQFDGTLRMVPHFTFDGRSFPTNFKMDHVERPLNWNIWKFLLRPLPFKGGPEPLEKEIHEILGSKREDRFSDPFFDRVQHTSLVRFSYLLRLCNFCNAPRDMRKFPQKCQKIAAC